MEYLNTYTGTIAVSCIVIISYFFSFISRKTKIPSVLLLISLGVGIQLLISNLNINLGDSIINALEILGVVGLIMIVLEAALDLKLKKENKPLLIKSFIGALLGVLATALLIATIFNEYIFNDFAKSLVYAIPLSILSSAIIIPSVASLLESKKEFMIYESTFSDILGIMFFYFVLGGMETVGTQRIVLEVSGSILITVALSIVVSYLLVLLLQKLEGKVKLFFLIAVLILLYSTGKLFHLSSLLIIMVFGLVLNNYQLFFKGRLAGLIDGPKLDEITEDFHIVTMETAFVVRTFFFVVFGMTLDFSGMGDLSAWYMAIGVLAITYLLRWLFLKILVKRSLTPQLWIAPRGLITVLLFFSIPATLVDERFNPTILLIVILVTSAVMSIGLIAKKEDFEETDELSFDSWEELDEEVKGLTSKEK